LIVSTRTLLLSAAWVFGLEQAVVSGQSPDAVLTIRVPATSNPYLAGMPKGTVARVGDSVPEQSPALVELSLDHAVAFTFQASGLVAHGPFGPSEFDPPNGSIMTSHQWGAEHGISDVAAPMNSLLGVFLGDELPNKSRPPKPLKFGSIVNSPLISAELKQVFFIGTGVTKKGASRRYLVPKGATRLFLGVMDGFEWNNNRGSFTVTVTVERSDVSSNMFSVDSQITFAPWACLPDRSQCTPERPMVKDVAAGKYHVILPAHLEWGVSIYVPPGNNVTVSGSTGTVCLDSQSRRTSSCNGPQGDGKLAGEGFLSPDNDAGALISKTIGNRAYFSVNGRSGADFKKQQGYFEFDVSLSR
jgi:hypothetical protein